MERFEHGGRRDQAAGLLDPVGAGRRSFTGRFTVHADNGRATGYLLPATAIANSPRLTADAMFLAVGVWGAGLVSIGMAISILASLNGTVLSGARIPFAAARTESSSGPWRTFIPSLKVPPSR